jgi:hypothetical protein
MVQVYVYVTCKNAGVVVVNAAVIGLALDLLGAML